MGMSFIEYCCGGFNIGALLDFKTGVDTWKKNCCACVKEPCQSSSGGAWKHNLFWCFTDFGVCVSLYIPWANCATLCHTNAKQDGVPCLTEIWPCLISGCLCHSCCYAISMRTQMRRKHGIAGTTLTDCLALSCCGCCAAIQMANQAGVATPCSGSGIPEPAGCKKISAKQAAGVSKVQQQMKK